MFSEQAQNFVNEYLSDLRTQRKYSEHTLSAYQRDLRDLENLIPDIELSKLTDLHISRCVAKLHGKGQSPRTIARKLSAWRNFFDWLMCKITLPANPVEGIKAPKRDKPLPKALSQDDAIRLVSSAPSHLDAAAKLRDKAIFELLYSCGLRISELVSIDIRYTKSPTYTSIAWLNLPEQELFVVGKGNKQRSVPIGEHAVIALNEWLSVRSDFKRFDSESDEYALFIGSRRKRISVRAIQKSLRTHARLLGLPIDVHPHMLRHSFASHVLQSSGDLRAVQEMLGHSSVKSTQVYTSLDFQHLAKVYDAAHPRAHTKK